MIGRRLARRLRRALVLRQIGVWYHPAYRVPLSGVLSSVGMSPRRADDALTWILDRGLVEQPHEAPRASWQDLERVHTAEWLERLDQPTALARVLGVEEGRVLPASELLETWRRAVGATVAATRWTLRKRQPAVNLLGGFHHAFPDRGFGFCPLNDLAIAVARVRYEGFRGRVVVIDLDAHPPDGTAACLEDDAHAWIASLGVASAWEAGPRVRDLRLPSGTGDDTYLRALDDLLAELPRGDLYLYLAGADPLAGDRFGGLRCSEEGLRERDRRVLARIGRAPLVILPGGGYTEDAWRVLAGTAAEAAGDRKPLSPEYDPVRRRTLDVARTLDPERLRGGYGITEADIYGSLVGSPDEETRFLGFYTEHGLEYALERYGYLPALRRMGFEELRLELTTGEMPHRLRVTTALDEGRAVLVDLSLSIRVLNGWQCLFIEWLELREPRVRFAPGKPRLPGQEVPGLGLATETAHLLLRAAERLGLAAVALVPAWYHVAWMGRHDFVALDPEHQGRFEALAEVFADVPLLEITRRLHDPGVPLADGSSWVWEPVPMVRAVDPDLTAALKAERPAVDEARARWVAALRGAPATA